MDVPDQKHQWKAHADYAMQNSSNMVFIGVFSRDTLESIVTCGTTGMYIDKQSVKAIINHIRVPDNALAQIKISNLQFFCHASRGNYMTGMSNFNLDNRPKSLSEADNALFSITNRHYTRQQSKEAFHALHVSAILKQDVVLIGCCTAGDESVLNVLKQLVQAKEQGRTYKRESPCSSSLDKSAKPATDCSTNDNQQDTSNKVSDNQLVSQMPGNQSSSEISQIPGSDIEQKQTGESAVLMRPANEDDIERRRNTLKRETSFCEDWRTATLRSIEALQKIGPFDSDNNCMNDMDNDRQRLIDDRDGHHSGKKRASRKDLLTDKENNDKRMSSTERRGSRSTVV